jgi:hypothetical protein
MPSAYHKLQPEMFNGTSEGFWLFCIKYLPHLFKHFPTGTDLPYYFKTYLDLFFDRTAVYSFQRLLAVQMPRGVGKSTVVDALCIYLICGVTYNQNLKAYLENTGEDADTILKLINKRIESIYTIRIGSNENKATKSIFTVRQAFTDARLYPHFVEDFGRLLINTKSTKKKSIYDAVFDEFEEKIQNKQVKLVFTNGATIEGAGGKQSVQGGKIGANRPTTIIVDDLEDPKERYSRAIFDDNYDKVVNDYTSNLDATDGRLIIIGTTIGVGCTIDTIMEKSPTWNPEKKTGWKKIFYPALRYDIVQIGNHKKILPSETGKYYLDEVRFPQIYIDGQKSKVMQISGYDENGNEVVGKQSDALAGFYRDYFNILYDPTSLDTTKIHKHDGVDTWYRYIASQRMIAVRRNGVEEMLPCRIQIGLDGGGANIGNDQTAIVVMAHTSTDEFFVLQHFRVNKIPFGDLRLESRTYGYYDDVYDLCMTYNPDVVIVEAFGGNRTFYDQAIVHWQMLDKIKNRRYSGRLCAYNDTRQSKKDRCFAQFKLPIESGRFNITAGNQEDIVRQIQAMSVGAKDFDDLVDATFLSMWNSIKPNTSESGFGRAINCVPANTKSLSDRLLRSYATRRR